MKDITLDYFKDFCCIGGSCTHNCCLLWEIAVDKKTLKSYKKASKKKNKYGVDFCEKLKNGIDYKKRCFIMKKDGNQSRCPFLNGDNLCEIYINMGKDKLCQVCSDHPRFKNYYSDRMEWGVGLCCPQSANDILTFNGKVGFFENDGGKKDKKLKGFENKVLSFRKNVLDIVQDRTLDVNERLDGVLNACNISLKILRDKPWREILNGLEILDKDWCFYLENADISKGIEKRFEIQTEQLLVYFLFRHLITAVDELDLKTKAVFSVLSVLLILSMSGGKEEKLKEVAIRFSTEIEYSQENMLKILDIIDEAIVANEKT